MAMNADRPSPLASTFTPAQPPSSLRLEQLVDSGSRHMPQNLSTTQFATLRALLPLISSPVSQHLAARIDAGLAPTSSHTPHLAPPPPIAFDYRLALDELDTIARTRAGYGFTELPFDLQEAVLDLVASRDLTTRKLDLALWLEDLLHDAGVASI